MTKSSWKVEKLSSLKFQCQDSYEYLIDRMLDLKSKTQQMLNEHRVDEARSTSLFVGGIVLKLFEEGATEETRSKWTHERMTVASSTPWWYGWAEVAYPSLPHTRTTRDAEAIVTQISNTKSEIEFAQLMAMLRKVESLKVKDSWLEKCEVTRIKGRSATVEQVRSAVEHGVERDKLRVISEDSEYPNAQVPSMEFALTRFFSQEVCCKKTEMNFAAAI